MTAEKAIQWMQETRLGGKAVGDKEVVAVCDMAIAALRAQQERENPKPMTPSEYEVTEVCPHCENEITMMWDAEHNGYKAYCPVCGKRLMLCDACQHSGPEGTYIGGCDYDSETDTCMYNRHKQEED